LIVIALILQHKYVNYLHLPLASVQIGRGLGMRDMDDVVVVEIVFLSQPT